MFGGGFFGGGGEGREGPRRCAWALGISLLFTGYKGILLGLHSIMENNMQKNMDF